MTRALALRYRPAISPRWLNGKRTEAGLNIKAAVSGVWGTCFIDKTFLFLSTDQKVIKGGVFPNSEISWPNREFPARNALVCIRQHPISWATHSLAGSELGAGHDGIALCCWKTQPAAFPIPTPHRLPKSGVSYMLENRKLTRARICLICSLLAVFQPVEND